MHLISVFLFAFSANLDNFTVAIAYGIKKIKIGFLSNLLIAFISALGTFLSMSAGLIISRFMPHSVSKITGSVILIGLGIWFLKDFIFTNHKDKQKTDADAHVNLNELLKKPERIDADNSGRIDLAESAVLAFALTINNLGLGLGASITGLNIFITTACTFVFSILLILAGYGIGESWVSKFLGKYASLVSAVIVILLGLYDLIF